MCPRPAKPPGIPVTPGGWLSAFRYRAHTPSDAPLTPKDLGALVGASAATVRRWEAGLSRPTIDDLDAITKACSLTDLEDFFLKRTFRAREGNESPPTQEAFEEVLAQIRRADYPVILFDSFLFVRAANAYAAALRIPSLRPGSVPNRLSVLMGQIETASTPQEKARLEATFDRWLRVFWLWSATNCGTDAYIRFIRDLSRNEFFAERWRAFGFERAQSANGPLGGPFLSNLGAAGIYRALPMRMFIPPLYCFLELNPVDDVACLRIEEIQRTTPKRAYAGAQVHWSFGPFLPDGSFDIGFPSPQPNKGAR